MPEYKIVVRKILEDGTEVTIVNNSGRDPWEVARHLEAAAKRLKREPKLVPVLPGQMALGEVA